jgi:hypothetical protein
MVYSGDPKMSIMLDTSVHQRHLLLSQSVLLWALSFPGECNSPLLHG